MFKTISSFLTVLILLLCDGHSAGYSGGKYTTLHRLIASSSQKDDLVEPSKRLISAYDRIIREESQRGGHDWRLISAIAYNESRFNAHVVSPRGASGLMQIMPAVARQFNVAQNQVMDPRTNIRLAVKLITRIEDMLKLSRNISANDRISIMLACYNGGIGHVNDARNLALKHGGDPNEWDDVSAYLSLKADPKYIDDEVVKCGAFNGSGQTLAFVSKVISKYDSYCSRYPAK